MERRNKRGGSALEFALIILVLVPLFLGTGVLGINMIRVQQTAQLAHEGGYMFARGMDFSQVGNKAILVNIGSTLGLSTTSSATAGVIFSKLTYIDKNACAAAGAVDAQGNPAGCTNLGSWVFTQRFIIGNSSVRTSNLGSPLVSGPTGVTVDPVTGQIPLVQYTTRAGAVAQFSSVNPYSNVNGSVSGLPSRQFLYIAEAAAKTFTMSPYLGRSTYSYGLF
jgi:hypothetical protein